MEEPLVCAKFEQTAISNNISCFFKGTMLNESVLGGLFLFSVVQVVYHVSGACIARFCFEEINRAIEKSPVIFRSN